MAESKPYRRQPGIGDQRHLLQNLGNLGNKISFLGVYSDGHQQIVLIRLYNTPWYAVVRYDSAYGWHSPSYQRGQNGEYFGPMSYVVKWCSRRTASRRIRRYFGI